MASPIPCILSRSPPTRSSSPPLLRPFPPPPLYRLDVSRHLDSPSQPRPSLPLRRSHERRLERTQRQGPPEHPPYRDLPRQHSPRLRWQDHHHQPRRLPGRRQRRPRPSRWPRQHPRVQGPKLTHPHSAQLARRSRRLHRLLPQTPGAPVGPVQPRPRRGEERPCHHAGEQPLPCVPLRPRKRPLRPPSGALGLRRRVPSLQGSFSAPELQDPRQSGGRAWSCAS